MINQPEFEAIGKLLIAKKGDFLFKQGDTDTSIYVVKSGLLKAYYLTLEGKEFIKSFIAEGEFIGSLIACYSREPCTFSLACLEDCSLLKISFADLQAVADSDPKFLSLVNNSLTSLAMKKERREYELLCLSAQDRYTLFKQRMPNIVDRVTQNDIARYLGITPVALSRMKNQS